jgi:hypothetical protein
MAKHPLIGLFEPVRLFRPLRPFRLFRPFLPVRLVGPVRLVRLLWHSFSCTRAKSTINSPIARFPVHSAPSLVFRPPSGDPRSISQSAESSTPLTNQSKKNPRQSAGSGYSVFHCPSKPFQQKTLRPLRPCGVALMPYGSFCQFPQARECPSRSSVFGRPSSSPVYNYSCNGL